MESFSENKPSPISSWSLPGRVAFRFTFLYFGLYCLFSQILRGMLLMSDLSFRGLGTLRPLRDLTTWTGRHVFGITSPLVHSGNSLDTDFYWVQTSWLVVLAVLAAGIWSWFEGHRLEYNTLHNWFRLFLRTGLALQMFEYGMTKVMLTQFPSPSLITLVTPLGNLSLQGLLWTWIGAATPYQIFTGLAEVLAGMLLLVPRTTTLGALICLADMIQVFALNMTYDVGVKLFSFHLILMIVFLLAPDFSRLARFLLLNRPAAAPQPTPLLSSNRLNRVTLLLPILLGMYSLGMHAYVNQTYWQAEGEGSPRSPLYGIWNVVELSVNGQRGPATLNDYDRRWRRVIFDTPNSVVFQRTDDSFARYGISIDEQRSSLVLSKGGSKNWRSTFTFQRLAPNAMKLEGEMDGKQIQLHLEMLEFDTLRLLNSDFRWVRPPE